jgi:hypothetical protein
MGWNQHYSTRYQTHSRTGQLLVNRVAQSSPAGFLSAVTACIALKGNVTVISHRSSLPFCGKAARRMEWVRSYI